MSHPGLVRKPAPRARPPPFSPTADSAGTNQPIPKEINPDYSLEGLRLRLKLQYFGPLMRTANSLENPDAGKDEGGRRRGR